jgi:S1-C subfamily serine protease
MSDLTEHDVASPDLPDEARNRDERDASWRRQRQDWRRTEKARRYAARKSVRFPIFTRSVLLWLLIFALIGVSTAAVTTVIWANFNTEMAELREKVESFEATRAEATQEIQAAKNQAIEELNVALEPLKGFINEVQAIQFAPVYSPKVWQVNTLDDEGRGEVGTAFAVVSDDSQTLLLTSYDVVKAASVAPAPEITLVKAGAEPMVAELWAWDPPRDLAILKVGVGNLEVLDWATDEEFGAALGARIFPVSGMGGAGASLTSGIVIDQFAGGIRHDAEVGREFRGAPIVTIGGKVIAVASMAYDPLDIQPDEVLFAPPVNSACLAVIACGGGIREREQKQEQGAAPAAPAGVSPD